MKKGGNNSRKRAQGRSYKSGSQKRKAKKNEQKSELPKITMLLGNKCHDQRVTTEEIGKHRSETETEEPINELPGVSTATASDDEQEEPDISMATASDGEQHDHEVDEPDISTATASDNEQEEPDISMATASDDEQHDHEVDGPDISTATASDERIIDIYPKDVGLWPCHIRDTFRDYWLEQGSKNCRNIHSDFKNSGLKEKNRIRHCTASLLTRKHSLTGEIHDLSWLCYSESTGKVYCFPCKPLSNKTSAFTTGFNDWKHAGESIESHGKSPQHRNALANAVIRIKTNARLDQNLLKAMQAETKYWRAVLTRVIDVMIFLSSRGLAIRGSDEKLGSVHSGNFLGIVEVLISTTHF